MLSEIDQISFASYLLKPCIIDKTNPNNLIELADATGFIYNRNGKQYLITNLHVTSGRNICTGEIENSKGAVPDLIKFQVSVCNSYNEQTKIVQKNGVLSVVLYDQSKMPLWLIHPSYKRNVDIAVLPLDNLNPPVNFLAINDIQSIETKVSVADDVFVVGYPLALGTNENKDFPIWKRASIASEPSINYFNDGRKAFVIDGTTREGMSGSPVVFYSNFTQTSTQDGGVCFGMSPRRVFNFLGIYSGRLYGRNINNEKIEKESFLGLVWKRELIDEIIDGNMRDEAYE
ncbi:MAG: trypsin-like peptidase domain-containing protein [Alphaproteobacteria bacterium]|nr:trypsin-like peptidase domain-containing protein [Alphaproteobacteria bacterium]